MDNIATLPRTLTERHKQPSRGTLTRLRGEPDPVKMHIIEVPGGKSRVELSSASEASLKIEADKFAKLFSAVIYGEPISYRCELFYPHIVFCIVNLEA
jgi:hypothetical protein